MQRTVLIVDDDSTQRRLLEAVIGRQGHRTVPATGGGEALALLTGPQAIPIDLVLLDLVMPDMDGFTVLERVRPAKPNLPVIVLTAQSGIDIIVKAMRVGANDFMVKPASPERIQVSIENALKLTVLTGEVSRLTRRIVGAVGFEDIIGQSPAMAKAIGLARRAAASTIPVLIEGESGVGKELLSRAIQGSGERSGKSFVAVNCGAIPDNLVESILFGHERGAFTGAAERHLGKFLEATGGTLFLDEIGELKLDMQVKLLRALQEGEIDPVGGKKPVKVDIRLISATNRDLWKLVQEGKFREDLYYRLNVYPIRMPPLREHPEDIRSLAEHYTQRIAAAEGKRIVGIDPEADRLLAGYQWPGNVRQLENAVYRAVVLCDGDRLTVADFPQVAQLAGVTPPPRTAAGERTGRAANGALSVFDPSGHLRTLAEVEADMIRDAVDRYRGQMTEISRRLGIGRSTLYRKVRELGLEVRGE
jgi:DNA-binding NtrC family response regulator